MEKHQYAWEINKYRCDFTMRPRSLADEGVLKDLDMCGRDDMETLEPN